MQHSMCKTMTSNARVVHDVHVATNNQHSLFVAQPATQHDKTPQELYSVKGKGPSAVSPCAKRLAMHLAPA